MASSKQLSFGLFLLLILTGFCIVVWQLDYLTSAEWQAAKAAGETALDNAVIMLIGIGAVTAGSYVIIQQHKKADDAYMLFGLYPFFFCGAAAIYYLFLK